ncbi:hypothetical protein DPMN_188344 [Dreissena polymorpha]|uniref:Uncharacterized protein n=1 Tax=Dreissena polymorpha TaxID=45954 RepID=A0A9D4I8E8_DREPO|nr:hypothetical protein DPMN_188344 [Dreissena polymorpha]
MLLLLPSIPEGDNNKILLGQIVNPFHEDRKIHVAFRVLPMKNSPPSCSHVFQPTSIIFQLVKDIIGINLLTKFHKDRTVNVASRVKNTPPLGSHTNHLTKFHEDWTINVASRVLPRFYYRKMPRPWWHAFKATIPIFELIQDIIGTNHLTKFPDDRKINVKNAPPSWINLLTEFHEDRTINVASRVKNAPPLGSHVFQANITIFELIQDINKTNLLTKFHEDWTINKASIVLTRFYYSHNGKMPRQLAAIFFNQSASFWKINLLTKFHKDWTINGASRPYKENVPPLGSHVFQAKFHEDRKINVASRELTRQMLTPHNARRTTDDGQKAITKAHHEHVVLKSAKNDNLIFVTNLII